MAPPGIFAGAQVHLMGIGGAGMSALVPLLQRAGAVVSGCDLAENEHTQRLREQGVAIALGHNPDHVQRVDIVVHTSAVSAQHPELRAAQALGGTVLSRQACLAELLRPLRTVAIAGSHGKTSTTWMTGHLLLAAGVDPVLLVGGTVADLGHSGARLGAGEWAVVEVDESDGGFAHTTPSIAVVTNLEPEHLEHYGSWSGLCAAFARWLQGLPSDGTLIIPQAGLPAGIVDSVAARQCRVGVDGGDVHAREVMLGASGSSCRLIIHGEDHGPMTVPIPGRHMLHNALMAAAAVYAVHGAVPTAALAGSGRVARRFSEHGVVRGVRVVEDYAHHPTEIAATIAAAQLAGGAVQVMFQPHRYTRTRDLLADFAACFDGAATVVIVPTYAASEAAIAGADGVALAEAIAQHRQRSAMPRERCQYAGQWRAAIAFVCAHAQAGDSILVLGAGDIGDAVPTLIEALA